MIRKILFLWHNLSLCHMQKEDYDAAKEDLGKLLEDSSQVHACLSDAWRSVIKAKGYYTGSE